MILNELLHLASIQDEYHIVNVNTNEYNTYKNVDSIPKKYDDMEVVRLYGYDAEGYDGLQIFVK